MFKIFFFFLYNQSLRGLCSVCLTVGQWDRERLQSVPDRYVLCLTIAVATTKDQSRLKYSAPQLEIKARYSKKEPLFL